MDRKYKTPQENFTDNRSKKFDQNTLFMVTYVDSPNKTSTNQWGKTQLDGYYIIWNPADRQHAFVQKWMLSGLTEKVRGDILKWDDFKTGKVNDYKPIYLEWKNPTPDKDGNMYDDQKFYDEHLSQGLARYGGKSSTPTQDEFYKNFTERELRFLLKTNGFEEDSVDADLEFIMEENKQLDIRTALYLLCKRLNIKQKVIPTTPEPVAEVVLDKTDVLNVIEGMFKEILKRLDDLTSSGNITLKDLLSKSKLEVLLKGDTPPKQEEVF